MLSPALVLAFTLYASHATALPVVPTSTFSPAAALSSTPSYDWTDGYISEFTIHSSCNATERHELSFGLEQAVLVARHAKEHLLIHGNESVVYQKYFGQGPTAPVIGWLDKIATANRAGLIFRCDDPDQNCATQLGWAGHHRGSNATSETVICPLSYTSRLHLTALCARGFVFSTGKPNTYWAADLMHRLYHLPAVGEGEVDHYADTYADLLSLPQGTNYTNAGKNSASLSYFALEAYAYDISVPGEGCAGKVEHDDHDYDVVSSTVTSAATITMSSEFSTLISATPAVAAATTSAAAAANCHTHDDGVVHCS